MLGPKAPLHVAVRECSAAATRLASVHLQHYPRPSKYVSLQRNDPETSLGNQGINRTIYRAAATDAGKSPKRVNPVLQPGDSWIGALSVFVKDIVTPGLEDTTHLAQRGGGIANRTERPGRHHTIKPASLERKSFPTLPDQLNRKRGRRYSLGNFLRKHFLGVNRDQARNASRIVPKVEPGAKAHLKNLSISRF